MRIARTFWIVEALGSALVLVLVYSGPASGSTSAFGGIELALFAVAFLLVACLGGPGKVLALGAGLGVVLATLAAAGSPGCGESDFICFTPGEVFALGLIVAGALYPGWALGAGIGALVRGTNVRRSSR